MPLGQKKTTASGLGRSKSSPPRGTMNTIKIGDYVKVSMGVGKVIALPNPAEAVPMYSVQLSSGTVVEYAPEYVQPVEKPSNPPRGERTWEGWTRDEETGWYSEESRKRGDPQSYVVFIMNFSHGAGDLDRYQAEFGQFMGTTIPITGNVYCDIVKALNEAHDFMQQYHRIKDLDAWFNKYHARQVPHSYDTYKMIELECYEKWSKSKSPRGENPEGKTFRVSLLVGSHPPRNEVEILHMGPMATRVDATEAIKRMPKYWRERMEILAIDEVKKGER